MKKVLLVATVQSHIAQFHSPLINMLKKEGYVVDVAARDNLNEKQDLYIENVDNIYNVPFNRSPFSLSNIKSYKIIKKILDTNDYDIIHCNTPVGGLVGRLAALSQRKKGLKVIYTAHGFHFYRGAPILNWILYYPIEKILAKITDKLITISNEDFELATKKFNVETHYIPGVGVDQNKFFKLPESTINKIKKEFHIQNNDIVFFSIGELNTNKNQSLIIEAISILKKIVNYRIVLIIAGNGPMEREYKKLVKKLNLEDNIFFIGYTRNINEYMNVSEYVISVSKREGLPINIIEGMMSQKVILASKNRGHIDLIKNGFNGFIVDTKNAKILSEEMEKAIILNIKTKSEISKMALKTSSKFRNENVTKDLKKIYLEENE